MRVPNVQGGFKKKNVQGGGGRGPHGSLFEEEKSRVKDRNETLNS